MKEKKHVSSDMITMFIMIILGVLLFVGILYLYKREEQNRDYINTTTVTTTTQTTSSSNILNKDDVTNNVNNILNFINNGDSNLSSDSKNYPSCNKFNNLGYIEDKCVTNSDNCKNIWDVIAPFIMNCYYGNNYPYISTVDENNNQINFILMNKDQYKEMKNKFEINNKYSDYTDFDLFYTKIENNNNIYSINKDNLKNNYSSYLKNNYKIIDYIDSNIKPNNYTYNLDSVNEVNNVVTIGIIATNKIDGSIKNGMFNLSYDDNNNLIIGKLRFL